MLFRSVLMLFVTSACAMGCIATASASETRRVGAALGAGVLAALALLCSVAALPMIAAAMAVAVALTPPLHASWRRWVRSALIAGLSVAIVIAVPIAYGYDLIATTVKALAMSHFGYQVHRSYWVWLRFNLVDYAIFLGVPLVALGLGRAADWLVYRRTDGQTSYQTRLVWIVAGFVAALDLAGESRGEVGRQWMPLMPFAIVALTPFSPSVPSQCGAAYPLVASQRNRAFAGQLLLGSLLAIVCIALRLYWNPA